MHETPDRPSRADRPNVRFASVIQLGDAAIVTADEPGSAGKPAFAPFSLGKVLKSMTDWLATVTDAFWQRHERCIAVLLVYRTDLKSWSLLVPTQQCSRDGSCWSVSDDAVAELPDKALVLGSFQSRVLLEGEDAIDVVPPFDGVHFVQRIQHDLHTIWCFLRTQGETRQVDSQEVISNDLGFLLQECESRLTLI